VISETGQGKQAARERAPPGLCVARALLPGNRPETGIVQTQLGGWGCPRQTNKHTKQQQELNNNNTHNTHQKLPAGGQEGAATGPKVNAVVGLGQSLDEPVTDNRSHPRQLP